MYVRKKYPLPHNLAAPHNVSVKPFMEALVNI